MLESQMETLVTTQYRHGYFKNQLCPCLSVRPAGGGLREMINHGLMIRPGPGGFELLYDTRHAGNQRTRADILDLNIVIRLLLRLDDPDFYNYTAPPPADIGNQVFYFYNRPDSSFLHANEQVSADDLFFFERRRMSPNASNPLPPSTAGGPPSPTVGAPSPPQAMSAFGPRPGDSDLPGDKWILSSPGKKIALENTEGRTFEKPFAILDLLLQPGLEGNYQIAFQPPSTWWNYILVSDHLKELNNPAIINTGTKENFAGPSTIRLRDDRAGLSFVSPAPIGLKQEPAATCMLVENFDPATGKYKVVLPTLPGPDTRIVSGARGKPAARTPDKPAAPGNPTFFSEIFLY
jgi:hypothetical protein